MERRIRSTTGYRIPPDIERKIDSLIEMGEFNTKADVFTAALRFYFENKNRDLKDEFMKWIESDSGGQYMEMILKRIQKKRG